MSHRDYVPPFKVEAAIRAARRRIRRIKLDTTYVRHYGELHQVTQDGPTARICTFCGTEDMPPRRQSWCSDECVKAAYDRANPQRISEERDRGVCASCGRDCFLVARVLRHAANALAEPDKNDRSRRRLDRARYRVHDELVRWLGFTPGRVLYDADHIVELIDGGTHEPDNIQTLCVPCHKAKSARSARARADRRRGQTRMELG